MKEMRRGYALLFSFVSSLRKKEENVKWCKKADMSVIITTKNKHFLKIEHYKIITAEIT